MACRVAIVEGKPELMMVPEDVAGQCSDQYVTFCHTYVTAIRINSDKLRFYHLAVESENKLATICSWTGPKV